MLDYYHSKVDSKVKQYCESTHAMATTHLNKYVSQGIANICLSNYACVTVYVVKSFTNHALVNHVIVHDSVVLCRNTMLSCKPCIL